MSDPAVEAAERVDSNPSPMAEYYFESLILAAREALARVRDLHHQNRPEDGDCQGYRPDHTYGYLDAWCVECSEHSNREYGVRWPCATARLSYTSEELNR